MAPPRQVPLFDLVSKRQPTPAPGAAARTQTKPTVRLEAAPASGAAASTQSSQPAPIHIATPRAAHAAPSRDPEPPHSSTGPGGAATLPRNQVIWIAAAAILVIILISYIVGVTLGKRQAETKAERDLRQLQPRPVEPLGDGAPSTLSGATSGAPSGATSGNRAASGQPASSGGVTQVRPVPAPARPAPMSSTRPAIRGVGQPQSDPRQVDLNYLALANLSDEDSRAAIAYLGSRGLDAFAIPLETGGGAANNRGPAFRLFALPGISAEEFRQRKTNRTNLEAAVLRLGEQWQKQERGPSNFSKPGWEKYTGG